MGYGINLGGYVGTTYVVIMSSTTGGIFSNCRQVDTEPLGRKKGHASIADCVPRRVALRIVKLRIARASNKIKAIYYVGFTSFVFPFFFVSFDGARLLSFARHKYNVLFFSRDNR